MNYEKPDYVERLIAHKDDISNVNITPHFYRGKAAWFSQVGRMDKPAFTILLIEFLIKQLGSQALIEHSVENSDKRYFGEHEKGMAVLCALEHAKMLREGGLEVAVNNIVVDK